ncbi:transposase [Kitasatospora sp. NPDC087271]|uniref:transposase n=1 Tax=Kitasatospora sp. NPDC087271 TaxID=3364067 RepID=UPI003823EBB2
MRVRDALGPLFEDEVFRSAFGVRGRPGVSPGQLALVCVLQFAENLTDRQAAHATRARIDWKYLLSVELSDPGFDFTVLTGFRDRILAHGLEEKVLDLLLQRLMELGLVAPGGRQRTDSTHVLAAVRDLNRLEGVVTLVGAWSPAAGSGRAGPGSGSGSGRGGRGGGVGDLVPDGEPDDHFGAVAAGCEEVVSGSEVG